MRCSQPLLVTGVLLLGSGVAGCAYAPEPTGTADPTWSVEPTQKVVVAPRNTVEPFDGTPDGYLDMGYGTALPIDAIPGCDAPAELFIGSIEGEVITEILRPENLADHGPRQFAQGEVAYDDEGRIATYTVAAGDVPGSIAGRLCLYGGGVALKLLNGYTGDESIHPGDVLVVDPAAVPDFVYTDPYA